MKHSTLKLFSINKHPTDDDIKHYLTHSCNPEYIHKTVLRFGLHCDYPQTWLRSMSFPHAKAEVLLNGVKIHMVLSWNDSMTAWSLWTIPDRKTDLERFEKIFDALVDIHLNRGGEEKV